MIKTDTVVIGSGPGGYVAAIRLGQLGVKTVIVEKESLGGVCLNIGCIPSKAFINAAKIFEHIQHAAEVGIEVGTPKVDLGKMKAWKDTIVQRLTNGVKTLLEKNGVTVVRGTASFKDKNHLTIAQSAGQEEIEFKNAIIATGSRTVEIPTFKFDGKNVISSTHALDLTEVPKRLTVIGGGVIGMEIGMYMQKLGAEVTVVEMLDTILLGTDAEVTKTLMRVLKKRGIKVYTSTKALGWSEKAGALEVSVEDAKGQKIAIPADKILVSVGRKPNTDGLGCDKAGVKLTDRGFVTVDNRLRTSAAHIYAIGDVTGGMLLAHKASKEGLVAAAVIAGGKDVYDVRALPWGIFTDPEIGAVGLTEEEATKKGYEVKVGKFPFTALGKALAMRETEGFVKLVTDAKTDQLLGCHVIGPEAADLVAEAALAIEMGGTAEDIALTVHSHPTLMESLMEAAEAVHGKAIHILNMK